MKQMITVITANERIADLEEKLESSEKMLQLFRDKSSKLTREVS